MWKKFTHPSIAAFRGVNTELFQLALVRDWEENGNIIQYIESHPEAPRPTLVPIFLPRDIIHLTTLPVYSCCKSRGVCDTFTRWTCPMEI
jgi:hypothetical protein